MTSDRYVLSDKLMLGRLPSNIEGGKRARLRNESIDRLF